MRLRTDASFNDFRRRLNRLDFAGLSSSIKEKLKDYEFLNVNQLLQKVVAVETRLKESCDTHRYHRSKCECHSKIF
jgi:hypothetical protein